MGVEGSTVGYHDHPNLCTMLEFSGVIGSERAGVAQLPKRFMYMFGTYTFLPAASQESRAQPPGFGSFRASAHK